VCAVISSPQPCVFTGIDRLAGTDDTCLSEHPVTYGRVTGRRCWLIGLPLECYVMQNEDLLYRCRRPPME
jgi:hypothetical protein